MIAPLSGWGADHASVRPPSLAVVTMLLDVLGLLLLAAGAAAALWPLVGAAALLLAGLVVTGGSALASYVGGRSKPEAR